MTSEIKEKLSTEANAAQLVLLCLKLVGENMDLHLQVTKLKLRLAKLNEVLAEDAASDALPAHQMPVLTE